MSISRKFAGVVAGLSVAVLLAGCGSGDADGGSGDAGSDKGSAENPVRIGVSGASDPQWQLYTEAAEEEGISVEIIDFAQYEQANPALTAGEIDLNQFQHLVYQAQYNEDSGEDLAPIGSTAIFPLGLYSTQFDSVEDIPDGSTIAISSDPSNRARGLLILQSAGLITLTGGGSITSTPAEIDAAESRVEVTELEPSLTATSLPDVAAAVINNDYVNNAGLSPTDAIAGDDPDDPNAIPYVNVFTSRAEDKENETYLKLVEIFQNSDEVLEAQQEKNAGTAIQVQVPVAELEETLAEVQETLREAE